MNIDSRFLYNQNESLSVSQIQQLLLYNRPIGTQRPLTSALPNLIFVSHIKFGKQKHKFGNEISFGNLKHKSNLPKFKFCSPKSKIRLPKSKFCLPKCRFCLPKLKFGTQNFQYHTSKFNFLANFVFW